MSQLLFEVTNQRINRIDHFKPVAGSRNYLYAYFSFLTSEWAGAKIAVFTKGNKSYKMLLDNDGRCLVPWELLVDEGILYVSCYCGDLVTANKSRVTIYKWGYVEDAENEEPITPNVYDQLIGYINSVTDEFLVIDGGTFDDGRDD